ncbi:MAG: recombination protein RecR [Kiritimatiellae bacterium]|nr:recombination protein RecR [Kiritimatiellia bacterium]
MNNLKPIEKLISTLSRLPTIGRRSAERMALKIARDQAPLVQDLITALREVSDKISTCSLCGSLTTKDLNPCKLCTDVRRDHLLLCVVEDSSDIIIIESARGYRGRYHALMGKISPLRGEGIHNLRIQELIKRIKKEGIKEVILALNTDVESDATASFLSDILSSESVTVSRIAFGLPAGSGIAYSDPVTLTRAIQGRQKV